LDLKKQALGGNVSTDWTAHLVVGKTARNLDVSTREDFEDILGVEIFLAIVNVWTAMVV
jgi:hypothetical protein